MRNVRSIVSAGLVTLGALLIAAPAIAQEGTLKKIKDTNTITLGHRDASIPFSYFDDKQMPVGYAMDLCGKIVDAVKAELKMPNLQVKLNPVTSATRIPLMANGTVDLECGSTTNNLERQAQVGFSDTTFIVSTKFIAKKASNLKTLNDLKGKTVVCTAGTNTLARVNGLNAKHNLGMTVLTGKDHAESLLMVETGRAVAFFEDDILLTGLAANSRNPAEWAIGTEAFSIDPYALMLPRGDAAFKQVVDRALVGLMKSGEILKIYDKWYAKPIPPKNMVLNFPLSPALKKAFDKPTDSPDPSAYE